MPIGHKFLIWTGWISCEIFVRNVLWKISIEKTIFNCSVVFVLIGDIFRETFPRNGHAVAAKYMPLFFIPWILRNGSPKGPINHLHLAPSLYLILYITSSHSFFHYIFKEEEEEKEEEAFLSFLLGREYRCRWTST